MRLRIALLSVVTVLAACGTKDGPSIVDGQNNDGNNDNGSSNSSANSSTNNDNSTANNGDFPGYVDGVACDSDRDCAGTCNIDSVCAGGGSDGVLPDGEDCTADDDCAGTCGDANVCEGDPRSTNNTANNNDGFPGYVDGTDCTDDSDCAGTCGAENTCEGGGEDGVLPDGEACTADADCAGECGADDTCTNDPRGNNGTNNGTNGATNASTNNGTNASTNNGTNASTNNGTGGDTNGGNNVSDAQEGETGGLCPVDCSAPVNDVVITCDSCAEGQCDFVDMFNAYCTRTCVDEADCADLGTAWECVDGYCDL